MVYFSTNLVHFGLFSFSNLPLYQKTNQNLFSEFCQINQSINHQKYCVNTSIKKTEFEENVWIKIFEQITFKYRINVLAGHSCDFFLSYVIQ